KNLKYVLYGVISFIINTFIQYICYLYKLRFVEISDINNLLKFIASIDFLVVMFIIIFIKELIIRNKER
ncbi:MAG: hypothetical protein PUC23_00855, partial [bacterium]|nr:hypothetical protein [bacterium]